MSCHRVLSSVLAASLCGLALTGTQTVCAAPVEGAIEADPHELALRWTLASLSPQAWPTLAPEAHPAPPAPAPRFSPLPHGSRADAVPDPGAYALMGALLLGAGLVGRKLTSSRRSCRPRPPARG
jgi:hypothetical protein